MNTPNNQPAPEGFRRLSSKWLETNVAPEDLMCYYVYDDQWQPSGNRGKLVTKFDCKQYAYATARTDLPREAYADSEPGAEVASERVEEQATTCGKCGEHKHTPWRDNEYGYVCLKCLAEGFSAITTLRAQIEAKEGEISQLNVERSSLEMAVKMVEANRDEWKRSWWVVTTERDKLRAERRELQGWKESAIAVMPPYQEIGKALGLTLGQSVHDKILPEIGKLLAENDKLLAECRELRELSERRAETIAVAMHNQKVADQDHASTVSSIRSENDKLRAEVEHRAKQRDEFQNLFIEASDGFNQRGEQLARIAAELDAVRKERDALQRFKDWVHTYLDEHGVPHHPPGTHGAEGCRIGDRMDWLMAKRDAAQARCGDLERGLNNIRETFKVVGNISMEALREVIALTKSYTYGGALFAHQAAAKAYASIVALPAPPIAPEGKATEEVQATNNCPICQQCLPKYPVPEKCPGHPGASWSDSR